jgi:hypothetical protein
MDRRVFFKDTLLGACFIAGLSVLKSFDNEPDTTEVLSITKDQIDRKAQDILANSDSPALRKLAKYREMVSPKNSESISQIMMFEGMPTSHQGALQMVEEMSKKLHEMDKNNISGNIIMEPMQNGQKLAFEDISSGKYRTFIRDYFQFLKENKITDSMMDKHVWTPFPEPNIIASWDKKNWNSSQYAQMVNNFIQDARINYPNIKVSVMMDATTHPDMLNGKVNESNWNRGDRGPRAFGNYLKGIRGLYSIGSQGFPQSGEGWQDFNPSEFLNPQALMLEMKKMNLKQVWLNTGTAGVVKSGDKRIIISPQEREKTLNQILSVALELISSGASSVTLNLFCENKLTIEGKDWSYDQSMEDKQVLADFVRRVCTYNNLNQKGKIKLSFFNS